MGCGCGVVHGSDSATELGTSRAYPDIRVIRSRQLSTLSSLQAIDDPSQVLLRREAGDAVAVGLTLLAPPRHEDIEVQVHEARKAGEIGLAVALPEQNSLPFPTLDPDRVSGKQQAVLAIVP